LNAEIHSDRWENCLSRRLLYLRREGDPRDAADESGGAGDKYFVHSEKLRQFTTGGIVFKHLPTGAFCSKMFSGLTALSRKLHARASKDHYTWKFTLGQMQILLIKPSWQ
jgi:hypothetical protein